LLPTIWQAKFLRSTASQVSVNCGRQTGKSTVVAAGGLHTALYVPGSLTIFIAPSLRQSRELAIKVNTYLEQIEPAVPVEENNKLSITLSNASRIVALPGDNPKTIRGYSASALVIEDEAAFVHDETHAALVPMLAASPEGRLILLSTPFLTIGHFYEIWHGSGSWERYELPSEACPRISKAWLEERRRENPLTYEREYCCRFYSGKDSLFPNDVLDRLVAHDFEPFLPV
jgi:Terminase large subunit, T4likevirus-type, N-terminal